MNEELLSQVQFEVNRLIDFDPDPQSDEGIMLALLADVLERLEAPDAMSLR